MLFTWCLPDRTVHDELSLNVVYNVCERYVKLLRCYRKHFCRHTVCICDPLNSIQILYLGLDGFYELAFTMKQLCLLLTSLHFL